MNLSEPFHFQTTGSKAWADIVREVFGGLEVTVKDRALFEGAIETCRISDLMVALVTSSSLKVWHTGSIGTFSEAERFLVKTQLSGQSHFSIGDTKVDLHAGEFIICDNARAYTFEFDGRTEIVSIPIPKTFLGRFIAHPEDIAFRKSPATVALTGLTTEFLSSVWKRRNRPSILRHGQELLNNYFELLVQSYEASNPVGVKLSAVRVKHLERCKAYISANLGNADLGPDDVAQAMSLSVRYISSLFRDTSDTIGKHILHCRLDHAAQMLRSMRFNSLTIAEIAFKCGFKSASHFSRSFKDRFSESPKLYRMRDCA